MLQFLLLFVSVSACDVEVRLISDEISFQATLPPETTIIEIAAMERTNWDQTRLVHGIEALPGCTKLSEIEAPFDFLCVTTQIVINPNCYNEVDLGEQEFTSINNTYISNEVIDFVSYVPGNICMFQGIQNGNEYRFGFSLSYNHFTTHMPYFMTSNQRLPLEIQLESENLFTTYPKLMVHSFRLNYSIVCIEAYDFEDEIGLYFENTEYPNSAIFGKVGLFVTADYLSKNIIADNNVGSSISGMKVARLTVGGPGTSDRGRDKTEWISRVRVVESAVPLEKDYIELRRNFDRRKLRRNFTI